MGRAAGAGAGRAAGGGVGRAESAGARLGLGFGFTVESALARPGTDAGGLPGEIGSAGVRGSAAESDGAAGSKVSEGYASATDNARRPVSTRTWAVDPGFAAGRTRYTRAQPASSRITPTTFPMGIPLG